jgi:hypothetical protein
MPYTFLVCEEVSKGRSLAAKGRTEEGAMMSEAGAEEEMWYVFAHWQVWHKGNSAR